MNQIVEFLLARIAEDEVNVRSWQYAQPAPVRRRALAECEAKRRMIAHWQAVDWQGEPAVTRDYMVGFLKLMALPYAGHPHYRSDWRP